MSAPAVPMVGPWDLCPCGHMMILHDVEDMAGTNPRCCVDGCEQYGCGTEAQQTVRPRVSVPVDVGPGGRLIFCDRGIDVGHSFLFPQCIILPSTTT